jgi:hypothetical protein
LSAVLIDMADRIGDEGFGVGVYQFKPTYLTKDKPIEQVRKVMVSAIQASAPSYGMFSKEGISRGGGVCPAAVPATRHGRHAGEG